MLWWQFEFALPAWTCTVTFYNMVLSYYWKNSVYISMQSVESSFGCTSVYLLPWAVVLELTFMQKCAVGGGQYPLPVVQVVRELSNV